MNAFSIGFIPKSWTDFDPDNEEKLHRLNTPNGVVEFNLDDYKKNGTVHRVYTDVELLEVSVVPVPANPDALQRMRTLSAQLADFVKEMDPGEKENKDDPDKKEGEEGTSDDKDKGLPGEEISIGDVVQTENEHAHFLTEEIDSFKSFRRVKDADIVEHKGIDQILGYDEEGNATVICHLFNSEIWTEEKAAEQVEDADGNFYPAKSTEKSSEKEGEEGDPPERKRIVPYKKYPIIDQAWDASAARKRLVAWAGGPEKEEMDFSKFRLAFGWYDESKADTVGAYKYPHHDVVDGSLKTNIRGVIAAMGVVNGARGGGSLSDSDRSKLYNHLAKHYRDADMEPPDLKEFDDPELDPALDALLDTQKMLKGIGETVSAIKEKIVPSKSEGSNDDPSEDEKTLDALDRILNGMKEIRGQAN